MRPMMGVFNNLVMFKQHVPQNSLQSIVPDLATGWSWSEDGTELTFPLRQGVKWHDGKPFTAADVKCTWDLLQGKASREAARQPAQILVQQPRRGDDQRRLRGHLPPEAAAAGVARAARLRLVAGLSLPCPAARDAAAPDRHRPVQIRRVQAERIHQGRRATRITGSRAGPISTASSGRSSRDVATRDLAFVAGKFDLILPYGVTIPLLKEIKSQAPQAICEVTPTNVNRTLIVNRDKPPFDNPDLRRAMALTLDRKAFIDIITEGQGDIGGTMLPAPEGVWGMPPRC